MVIHPSLNEVTGWAIGSLKPVKIKMEHHGHNHDHLQLLFSEKNQKKKSKF